MKVALVALSNPIRVEFKPWPAAETDMILEARKSRALVEVRT